MREIDVEYLNECLELIDGDLFWRNRPESHFSTYRLMRSFNAKFSGKPAGCIKRLASGAKYKYIRISGVDYRYHRLVWALSFGEFPSGVVDHINGDSLDNRLENLRDVTVGENNRNRSVSSNSTTKITGVTERAGGKYQAVIRHSHRYISLGTFDNLFDAACARKSAEVKYGFTIRC